VTLLILIAVGLAAYLALTLWAGANTLTGEMHLTGNFTLAKGLANRQAYENMQIGQNGFPAQDITYTDGSGTNQGHIYFCNSYTIAGTTANNIDLNAAVTDDMGQTVTMVVVKEIIVAIDSPDGSMKVRVGPQGQSNPFIGPWSGGQGATVYEDVYTVGRWSMPFAGWTVTAGTGDILGLYNPGATAITVHVLVIGA
jgi:hypothetical protein